MINALHNPCSPVNGAGGANLKPDLTTGAVGVGAATAARGGADEVGRVSWPTMPCIWDVS